jgi:hypothetical protein
MIVLINGGPRIDRFGMAEYVGRLISPRGGPRVRPGESWAGDNDAFGAWDEDRFVKMLCRVETWPGCLFVAAPDVVGKARETMERFDDWRWEIVGRGLPVALVGQDGIEDMDIPWDSFDAWFIGGSTEWKLSSASAELAVQAKRLGKWVHMGRVNSHRRLQIAYDVGCDSVDGTGWSKFPDEKFKRCMPFVRELHEQLTFFGDGGFSG